MGFADVNYYILIAIFAIGYIAIILEYYIKVNKTATALLIAVGCWAVDFLTDHQSHAQNIADFSHFISDVTQIIFFLMGAMTIVEVIDIHNGFALVTNRIRATSQRQMLWIVSITAFLLSAILDNLTTTILMVSLLRKIIPKKEERLLLGCLVVIAANAGGAWTPIGDVTTTMLWINGQLSSISVMQGLIVPSLVSLLVPLLFYSWRLKGPSSAAGARAIHTPEPGAMLIFIIGVGGLIFVPVFKWLTGLPPFMSVLFSLGMLWLATDLLHLKHKEKRKHLRFPHILTRVDTSGILFFLGILLAVSALNEAGVLNDLAQFLNQSIGNLPLIATVIGLLSAIVDNVPLVAATMGMYSLEQFPMDSSLWHMIAYAAGTGGSILIIGSSAGIAFMGIEKIDFVSYLKKASLPALIGFLAGMGVYLLMR